MDRDLGIGIVAALVLHAIVGWWGWQQVPRPRPPLEPEERLVRTVRAAVALPPRPPPPPPPEPAPQPQVATANAAPAPRATAPRTRPVKPSAPKPVDPNPPPPANEPPPLVLSQTYGSGSDPGVAVHTGDEDVLGDPGVEPTESNRRQRSDEAPATGGGPGPEGGAAAPAERKVDIVHAGPLCNLKFPWPEGARTGNRIVEVTLSLRISTSGTVVDARILRSAGEPFDSAAVAAVRACAFRPGLRDGRPFVDHVPFAVEFKAGGAP